ncbi:polymorphic toxin-type HINT domain-containing protein [Rhodopirellula sp. P2]|uniref:polymorphic toxin-type HINT domain-containing protein n=1 Tax=Rhodopirellula sp. P2 TaxID=2127060 RepID=UPI002368DB2F|nr:polymorphic toxin-type HINT domain-containing protein [Rhodopirellula sp. P2]WDQ19155.1 polymorphic toxin-type HINT domain-containing protein [Rhodopirellula sp. P2]
MKTTRLKPRFGVRYSMGIFLAGATCVAATGIESQVHAADATWSEQLVDASSIGNVQLREQLLENPPADLEAQSLANALKGRLKDTNGQWVSIEESVQDDARSNRIAEYESRRDAMQDTAADHWQLSRWCRAEHMPGRARAHAFRVVELDRDHAAAHRYLGNVRVGDAWVAAEEAVQQQKELRETQQNLRVHTPKIRAIAEAFRSTDSATLSKARTQLERIDTADAIDAVLQQAFSGSDGFAMAAVNWLGERDEADAAVALARLAVFDQRRGLRDLATQQLKSTDPMLFVPTLLDWCQGTIESTHRLVFNEGDRSFDVVRQYRREDAEGVKVLDSVTKVVAVHAGASPTGIIGHRDAVESLQVESARDASVVQSEAERFNARSRWLQSRTAAVIEALDSNFDGEPSAESMRDWWYAYRGYGDTGLPPVERRLVRNMAYREVSNAAPIGSTPRRVLAFKSGSNGTRQLAEDSGSQPQTWAQKRAAAVPDAKIGVYVRPAADCLVAGTLVWTDRGMRPVESLRLGDQVLSCDVTTGELSYQSVLRQTVREPEPLTKIQLGSDEIVASKGHPFWVIGRGWTTTEQLVPGDALHGADGVAVIDALGSVAADKTYNLVVEHNHSYFVGKSRILSHDAEVERPDGIAMPGVAL